jgi:hypothetical protein
MIIRIYPILSPPPPPPIVVKRDKACLVFTKNIEVLRRGARLPFLFSGNLVSQQSKRRFIMNGVKLSIFTAISIATALTINHCVSKPQ